ncbi:MAG: NUDIX hydrolase [Anaerolineae bacterium]
MIESEGNSLGKTAVSWKLKVARLVRHPLLHRLMVWSIRLLVPRHRVGVVVVILDDRERVLMLRHVFHPFTPWGLPGGWLGHGESPAAGALRELKEETGLTAVVESVIHIAHDTDPEHIGIAFLGRAQPGPLTLSAEIVEADWFALDALPSPLLTFVQDAINAAVAARRAIHPDRKSAVAGA